MKNLNKFILIQMLKNMQDISYDPNVIPTLDHLENEYKKYIQYNKNGDIIYVSFMGYTAFFDICDSYGLPYQYHDNKGLHVLFNYDELMKEISNLFVYTDDGNVRFSISYPCSNSTRSIHFNNNARILSDRRMVSGWKFKFLTIKDDIYECEYMLTPNNELYNINITRCLDNSPVAKVLSSRGSNFFNSVFSTLYKNIELTDDIANVMCHMDKLARNMIRIYGNKESMISYINKLDNNDDINVRISSQLDENNIFKSFVSYDVFTKELTYKNNFITVIEKYGDDYKLRTRCIKCFQYENPIVFTVNYLNKNDMLLYDPIMYLYVKEINFDTKYDPDVELLMYIKKQFGYKPIFFTIVGQDDIKYEVMCIFDLYNNQELIYCQIEKADDMSSNFYNIVLEKLFPRSF